MELDIDAVGEAGRGVRGRRGQPVEPLLPVPNLGQQPPRRLVQARLQRLRIADHDRAPGELERGPRPLELLLEILLHPDILHHDADQAARASAQRT
jgi:hypothetical protein